MKNKSDLLRRPAVPDEGGDGPGASSGAAAGSDVGGHTSGGATGHGGTNPADIHETIEPDHDHDQPASPPEEFWNKKKGNKYS